MSDSEKWAVVEIANCKDVIEVSSLGHVRKTKSSGISSILGGTISSGFRYVYISGNQYAVHHLVARAFIPNPEGFLRVIHKNGNNLDNKVENLEWSSTVNRKGLNYTSVAKVKLLCPEAKLVFGSLRSAAYVTHIPQDIISRAIQEKSKICGLTFQWISSDAEIPEGFSTSYISFEDTYKKALASEFVQEFQDEVEKLSFEKENKC